MYRISLVLFSFLFTYCLVAQDLTKRQLDHPDFDIWRTIDQEQISNNGQWVTYALTTERQDPELWIKHVDSGKEIRIERGIDAKISEDNNWVVFMIKQPVDAIREMKRDKTKKEDLPLDTLAILNLSSEKLIKIENTKNFKIPEKWSDWIVYTSAAPELSVSDTSKVDDPEVKKGRENDQLIVKQLSTDYELTIPSGTSFVFAEEAPQIIISSESKDSTFEAGVYLFDCSKSSLQPIYQSKGKFKSLSLDKTGSNAAFLADVDTTDVVIRPYKLYHYRSSQKEAQPIVDDRHKIIPLGYRVSEYAQLHFSDDGSRLYFGIAPQLITQDTTLIDEEIVKVEVWSWKDKRLHTQQELEIDSDKKQSYDCVWHLDSDSFLRLGTENIPDIQYDPNASSTYALGSNSEPYLTSISWEGFPAYRDIYLINIETGDSKKIASKVKTNPQLSPAGKYIYWFDRIDTTWQIYNIESGQTNTLTNNKSEKYYNELNDSPNWPGAYGIAGWTEDDGQVLINDRYDIWKYDPKQEVEPIRITDGRASKLRYRYIQTDAEAHFIKSDQELLLSVFDEKDKSSGYASTLLNNDAASIKIKDNYRYNTRPTKARDANRYMFTKESFKIFPDLIVSDNSFSNHKRVSTANPQQSSYSWGSTEIYEWLSSDGQTLQGLLVKPDNFDPNKKYPMIVNFYERSSDGLHRHRAPYPHRSTINYAFYVSRGYVIFNPDVVYKVGYPGESAENSVISGTTALIREGFIDKDRIGVQGHSWGGYQIAHLITRSNLFACAESGAPVVNMFSAYGGIRWGSGLSRMFQYEHTQSRIGGTIWDEHTRYVENSPLFFLDKVETPVLIMHNDEDGAVPWYQGIEFFTSMRRLGKPAWLLNYNGEPHWPLKRQNRLDFNIRMQQFFDHYLKDQPLPLWMETGVPAAEVGIDQHLEPENSTSNPQVFDYSKDLLLGHFDCKTDVDDLHSVAAFSTLLSHSDYASINYHAVAGTYGVQKGLYVPANDLFQLAFGDNWTDAHADFDKAIDKVLKIALSTIEKGGDIWIADAGQSDFSAALVKAIQSKKPQLNTQQRVHIVQHSNWNESVTDADALQYAKENTNYNKIADGNATKNGTPGFNNRNFTNWKSKIGSREISNIWELAVKTGNQYNGKEGRYLNKSIAAGGLDFSDVSEICWILGLEDIIDTEEFFRIFAK